MGAYSFYEDDFEGETFSSDSVRGAKYELCTFKNCKFTGVSFIETVFEECEFFGCDFTGAFLNELALRDVRFTECKMIGLNFEQVNPFGLKLYFDQTVLDYAIFYQVKLAGTQFLKSSLKGTDFAEAVLSKASFSNSNLDQAIFDRTDLSKADFRQALNYQINPGNNQMKGAKFSKEGVSGLLRQFGVVIE